MSTASANISEHEDRHRPPEGDQCPSSYPRLTLAGEPHSMRAISGGPTPQETRNNLQRIHIRVWCVCVEGHTFLLSFSLMDDSKTVILKTYTIESIVRHEKTTAPFVHCPHSAYGKRSPFRTLVHSKRHQGDGAKRPADMWSHKRPHEIIPPAQPLRLRHALLAS